MDKYPEHLFVGNLEHRKIVFQITHEQMFQITPHRSAIFDREIVPIAKNQDSSNLDSQTAGKMHIS